MDEKFCTNCGENNSRTTNGEKDLTNNSSVSNISGYEYFVTSVTEFYSRDDYEDMEASNPDIKKWKENVKLLELNANYLWSRVFQMMLNYYASEGWEYYRDTKFTEPKKTKGAMGLMSMMGHDSFIMDFVVFRRSI
jgi:hypothetical protein